MTDNEKAATFIGWKTKECTGSLTRTLNGLGSLICAHCGGQPMWPHNRPAPDMVDPRKWAKALGYALTLDDWVELHPNIYEALVHRDWLAIVKMLAALYDAEHPA